MRISNEERLEAYSQAMHQLITVLNNVQHWVRLAKMGAADLMDPMVLDNLAETLLGETTNAAMDPVPTYVKKKIEQSRQERES